MIKAKNQLAKAYFFGYGDYLRFRELVLSRSGLNFPEKKRTDLELGLRKALQDAPEGITDLNTYYAYLTQPPAPQIQAEMDRLINLLTIGETHFFRDAAQFDALTLQVLPALIARKRAEADAVGSSPPGAPQLRLWSAGAATGEEPYSLAILLRELIPDLDRWRILILATDINHNALEQARKATYTDWSFRETRARSKRHLHFTRQDKGYHLHDDIRQMVTFAYHNLIEDDFPATCNNTTAMDMIFCRNVTIYFTEKTTRKLVNKFYKALVDGGWLVVGHAEPSLTTYRSFQVRTFPHTILYQKTGQPTPWPDNWEPLQIHQPEPVKPVPTAANLTAPLPAPKPTPPPVQPPLSPVSGQTDPSPFFEANNHSEAAPRNTYQTARQMLSQGDIDQAITILENDLANPAQTDQAPTYCLLAQAYADKGQWAQARHRAQEVLALDTLLPEAYYILAMIDEETGDVEAAVENLKKAIYLDRTQPIFFFNLAMLYQKTNQMKLAKRALKNAITLLERWPDEKIMPFSGGAGAARLLKTAQKILADLEAVYDPLNSASQ